LKAGEKAESSRFKRLFSRGKKEPKEEKEEETKQEKEKAPVKPSRFQRYSIKSIRQKQKEIEKKEKALETTRIKIITFIATFIAMALAFSLVPLLAQPLPILLALLVGFVTWQKPRIGMPVGSVIIGIGLLYHLSINTPDTPAQTINFIALIGDVTYRYVFAAVLMGLFVALPIIFYRYRHAIAINFGIMAAMSLASNSTYFLAIPLILTPVVFYKKDAVVAAVYYGLISVPLLIVEYFKFYIAQTPATVIEWWKLAGSSPPLFEPLTKTFNLLQNINMGSFRLFNADNLTTTIINSFTTNPEWQGKTMRAAIVQYRDSFPGIILFVVIIVGMVLVLTLLANSFVKKANMGERIMPSLTATLATALFFVLLGALQGPLAFTAKVDGGAIAYATLATLAFTLPVSLINYQPKKNATSEMITEKANELMKKLNAFENQINIVKTSIPLNISGTDVRMLIIKDKINDILSKAQNNFYEGAEIDKVYTELDKTISSEIDALIVELTAILNEYQIRVNTEYAQWLGRLKDDVGLDFKATIKPHYEPELPLEQRIINIQEVLEAGRVLAISVIEAVDPIYVIIRALYDKKLPQDSEAVAFAKKKLDEKAPWQSIQELYVALNNWRKQYSAEIAKSTEYLKRSLLPIIALPKQNDRLAPVMGDKMPIILAHAKKAQSLKETSDKNLNVLNLITIRNLLDTTLDISKDIFTVLNDALQYQEKSIEDMLPTSNYLWEKNATLDERMIEALIVLSSPRSKVNEIMENLPRFEGYIDECIQTLIIYNERREFLLNYPVAKIEIEDQLKTKVKLTPADLPFEAKYSAQYLQVFYLQNFNDYDFDKQNSWLTRKS
jgi:hypothetical protein